MEYEIDLKIKVVPIITEAIPPDQLAVKLLDTLYIQQTVTFATIDGNVPFRPVEEKMLRANGITIFTPAVCAQVKSLKLSMFVNSLADLLHFTGLEELDLVGAGGELDIFDPLPHFGLQKGGGKWEPFLARLQNPNGLPVNPLNNINIGNAAVLADLLDMGTLRTVRYIPLSMGQAFDDMLEPYVTTGQVVLVTKENHPPYVMVDNRFNFPTNMGMNNPDWKMNTTYYKDEQFQVPAPDQLIDPTNVYKCIPIEKYGGIQFLFPRNARIAADKYRYLKVKFYIESEVFSRPETGWSGFKILHTRFWNYQIGYSVDGTFGEQRWGVGGIKNPSESGYPFQGRFTVKNEDVGKNWTEFVYDLHDLYTSPGAGALTRNTRVITIQNGNPSSASLGITGNVLTGTPLPVMYYADIRFCQTIDD